MKYGRFVTVRRGEVWTISSERVLKPYRARQLQVLLKGQDVTAYRTEAGLWWISEEDMTTVEAYRDCPVCHGRGYFVEWVPYSEWSVDMRVGCDYCVERARDEGLISEDAQDVEILPWRDVEGC